MKTIKTICTAALLAVTSLSLTLASLPAAEAGRIPGPAHTADDVLAHSTDVYRISFKGHEEAEVSISGDGDTELNLYVYDAGGHLIASDTSGDGDDRTVTWTPRWTGRFTIKVANRGDVYNHYSLETN